MDLIPLLRVGWGGWAAIAHIHTAQLMLLWKSEVSNVRQAKWPVLEPGGEYSSGQQARFPT